MASSTRTILAALFLVCITASLTGCWAEGGGDPNSYSTIPGSQPAYATGAAGMGEPESTVWQGTPVDSSALQTGTAGSAADMGGGSVPDDPEPYDPDPGTGEYEDDPVVPDPPAPTGSTPTRGDASTDAAADPFADLFPPPSTTPPDRTPSPDNPAECPDVAPDNPVGDCAGLPVYMVCTYGTYVCICDWIHWMCAG